MAAENSRFRSRLFKSLRAGVVLNCICSVLFVCAILFHRSSISSLRSSLDSERLRNADLVTRLNIALKAITNDVFAAAGAFALSYTNNLNCLSPLAPSRLPDLSVVSNVVDELPPISFSGFFEVDGCPYISCLHSFRKFFIITLPNTVKKMYKNQKKLREQNKVYNAIGESYTIMEQIHNAAVFVKGQYDRLRILQTGFISKSQIYDDIGRKRRTAIKEHFNTVEIITHRRGLIDQRNKAGTIYRISHIAGFVHNVSRGRDKLEKLLELVK